MTRAQARTRDIYAANVEKSRATRDPITFQLHDASGALKKGGVAVEESGWDRPAPGARDGNDRAFPLPERALPILARPRPRRPAGPVRCKPRAPVARIGGATMPVA